MESPRKTLGRLGALVVAAAVLGAGANALSPRGISWTCPLGKGLRAEVAEAGFAPVDLAGARKVVAERSASIVDARAADLFRIGRLPGAVSVPWADASAGRVAAPPPGPPLLVYCSNEFCDTALDLARWLRDRGHRRIAVFVDGYDAWWNERGPVDQD